MDPVEIIKESFPVDTLSTQRIHITQITTPTRVYEVKQAPFLPNYKGELYIIDSKPGIEIACYPHIVGQELVERCKLAAKDFIKTAESLEGVTSKNTTILHILRAGAGYMVHKAIEAPIFRIRTQYFKESYRNHTDVLRNLKITFRQYHETNIETLIIPDTFATGRSADIALNDLIAYDNKPDKLILYGFIAAPALERISKLCEEKGISLTSFAICNITQLAYNNYDMPAYGLDESYNSATGCTRKLGSIIDYETLEKFISNYIPGLDQPGDWSERQSELFNGYSIERGKIKNHLERSMELIKKLGELSQGKEWFLDSMEEAAKKELKALCLKIGDI